MEPIHMQETRSYFQITEYRQPQRSLRASGPSSFLDYFARDQQLWLPLPHLHTLSHTHTGFLSLSKIPFPPLGHQPCAKVSDDQTSLDPIFSPIPFLVFTLLSYYTNLPKLVSDLASKMLCAPMSAPITINVITLLTHKIKIP